MGKVKKYLRAGYKRVLPGNLPHFLIIGAQKAGTTSLYFYLDQHSGIVGSDPKEVRFFDRDERYERGLKWYKKAFINPLTPFKNVKYFEATPDYLYRSYTADRIYKINPNMKLIVVLRNPIDRAFSSWNMYRDFLVSREKLPRILKSGYLKGCHNNLYRELYERDDFPTFYETIVEDIIKYESNSKLKEPSFVRRGIYHDQILTFQEKFGHDNLLILGFKDLFGSEKYETLNKILRFIGLKETDWDFLENEKKNVRYYPVKMNEKEYDILNEFYKYHNKKLVQMLGFQINW